MKPALAVTLSWFFHLIASAADAPPEVMLLGDSIRQNYQAAVEKALERKASVWAPEENCRHSAFVLEHLDGWLEGRNPRVVHLNAGLHDLWIEAGTDQPRYSLETYEKNLRAIFAKLKERTAAKVVFALTTPVNEDWQAGSETYRRVVRRNADIRVYNQKAREVAEEFGVVVNDLNGWIEKAGPDKVLRPSDGIHLSPEGAGLVGGEVAGIILRVLSAPANPGIPWKAGAAGAVITPAEPMYLAGFANREVPAEGTAMDLFAKALAIEDFRGTRFVMVTLDLIEVAAQTRTQVAAEVKRQFGLGDEQLLINCSHTHCGPELRYTEAEFAEFSDPQRKERCLRYNAFLVERIVGAIGEALGKLEPARLTWSHARCGFAMNRRLKNEDPTGDPYLNRPNPDGVVDHDVPVLAVSRADDSRIAIVFGYACHNTTANVKMWHGDYAGYAQAMIEEALPGAVALFVAGCGGDQNGYPRFLDLHSRRHGRSLATAVEAALETKPRELRGPLRLRWDTVRLDYERIPAADELRENLKARGGDPKQWDPYYRKWDERRLRALEAGQLRDHYTCPLQIVKFGDDLTLVGLSGETCVDYSLRLKRELPGSVWVAGYCNDIYAYVPSRRVLLEGGYEARRAMIYWSNPLHPGAFAETIEERIVGKVHEMVETTSRVNKQ